MKTFDIHVDMGTNSYDRKLNGEENIFKLKDVFIACFFSGSQDWFICKK